MNPLPPLDRVIALLGRLPGVGRRSAERMAVALLRGGDGLLDEAIQSMEGLRAAVCTCAKCGSVTLRAENPCRLCSDPRRESAVLCVVEDPSDIVAIERAGGYRGRYHALQGKLSPMKGQGPADARIDALVARVKQEGFAEVVVALNTDVEGDSTAAYIRQALAGLKVRVTRLARGLPSGSGIAYADPLTVSQALQNRREMP